MKRSDTPFARHWLYYLILKYAVIAAAVGIIVLYRLSALSRLMHHARERLYLFDTTLRDGAQTNGVDFTLADKLAIARMLDELGIDYVEAGYPGANPIDTEFFAERRPMRAQAHRLRHDAAARPLGVERSRASSRCSMRRPTPSASSPNPGTITCASRWRPPKRKTSPRSATACAPPRPKAAKCCSTASISSTATRPSPLMRWLAPRRPMRKARAGSCCATPMAARCRTRSSASSARSAPKSPAIMSASTPITTPSRRWRIRLPRCAPARGRSKARSTGSASAAATPISSRSSRR